MKPTIKENGNMTFHRDGTVSFWSCHWQEWIRVHVSYLTHRDLAELSQEERDRVAKMIEAAK